MIRLLTLLLCLAAPIQAHAFAHRSSVCNNAPLTLTFTTYPPPANCLGSTSYALYSNVPGQSATYGTVSGGTKSSAFNATGTLQYFNSGAQRITNAGISLDGAYTNLLTHGDDLANGSIWFANNATVATTTSPGPDAATNSAFTLTTSGSGTLFPTLSLITPITIAANTQYTMSAECQAITNTQCSVDPLTTTGGVGALVTIGAGTCSTAIVAGSGVADTSSGCLYHADNGSWVEAWATFTSAAGDTTLNPEVWLGNVSTGCATTCLGTSIRLFGVQVNTGPHHAYLPTTTVTSSFSGDTFTQPFTAATGQFCTVLYGQAQNSYIPCASPIDLVSNSPAWAGFGVSQVIVANSQPTPAPAVAASYNQLVLDIEAFSTTNVDMGCTYTAGFLIYGYNFSNACTMTNVSFNSDGSMNVGLGGNNFNATLGSAGKITGSTPYRGTLYGGGGYFEATLSWNACTTFVNGWEAWWLFSYEGIGGISPNVLWPGAIQGTTPGYTHYAEPDIMEDFCTKFGYTANQFNSTIIDWGNTPPVSLGSVATTTTVASTSVLAANHKYGALWVPATTTKQGSISYYFDGTLINTTYYTQLTTANQPPPVSPWIYGSVDGNPGYPSHFVLQFGSGDVPLRVQNLHVWQRDTSGDLTH